MNETMDDMEATITRTFEQITDNQESIASQLNVITTQLGISQDELLDEFRSHRDMLSALSPHLEGALIKMNVLAPVMDHIRNRLDTIESHLMGQSGVFSLLTDDEASRFWNKHFPRMVHVQSSILVEMLKFEYPDLRLNTWEEGIFLSLVDANHDNNISLPEWMNASRMLSSHTSLQESIRKLVADVQEKKMAELSFDELMARIRITEEFMDKLNRNNKIGTYSILDDADVRLPRL